MDGEAVVVDEGMITAGGDEEVVVEPPVGALIVIAR